MIVDPEYFHSALRDPALTIPAGLVDQNGESAGRRFNIYRNNVTTSLMDALAEGYPVIGKLLGEENFRNLAREYQAKHPPSSPLMMYFGEAFPAFLDGFEPLSKYPYLGDVARLEYALRKSYHAADAAPVDPSVFAELSEEALLAARFELAPAVSVLSSKWPVFGIWRFNSVEGAPKPVGRSENVLITRPEFDPNPEEISAGDAALISALQNNATLAKALEAATDIQPDHEFGAILGKMLKGNAITKIISEDQ